MTTLMRQLLDQREADPVWLVPTQPTSVEYITTNEAANRALVEIMALDVFGFDSETTGLDPTMGARMRLAQFAAEDGRVWVFDLWRVSPSFLAWIFPNMGLCVGMNIKFDYKFLMHEWSLVEYGDTYDVMLAGQVLGVGDIYAGYSLIDLAKRYTGVDISKDEQLSDWSAPVLTESQIAYAARDALLPLAIRERQIPQLKKQALVSTAILEFEATVAVCQMELNGMRLNPEPWAAIYHETKKEAQASEEKLWQMLDGGAPALFAGIKTINLNSPQQVIRAFEERGLPVPLNKDGEPTTRSYKLKPMESGYEEVRELLRYRKLAKALSSYGLNWIDRINPSDGRVHTNYRLIGAETGRMSSSKPNLTQVPKKDSYRNCFLADPGWVYVDADYSQIELRILAELCQDENFMRAFIEGRDLHRYSASLIFKVAYEDVTDEQRGIAKNLNFGIVYGIGAERYAETVGLTYEEAQRIIDYYFESFPGLKRWLDRQAERTIATGEARTMGGRLIHYRFDRQDREAVAAVKRNGKNYPIQGTSADITKRAMKLVADRVAGRKDIRMVHVIHDEIILEALPRAVAEAQQILHDEMLRAAQEYLKRVPVVVDVKRTLIWSKDPTKEQLEEAEALLAQAA
jgi:DNA polymerase-1